MMNLIRHVPLLTVLLIFVSCGRPGAKIHDEGSLPAIFPDYCGVTVPVNIAPLNFMMADASEKLYVVIEGKNGSIKTDGKGKIKIPLKKWHRLLKDNQNDSLSVTVFAKQEGKWSKYKPFSIHIINEPVDPWLVYRLIAPGYESWSEMGIYQRNLTSFEEEPVINNRLLPGACMNCHSFKSNNPDDMVFHLRGNIGATMLVQDGREVKLNTKTAGTISNCVYPYWHPSGNYIAFSVNSISQVFHSTREKRIEVFDSESDVVVYDIRNNKLLTTRNLSSKESFETFPAFTPDGRSLVFCSAPAGVQPDNYNKIKYSLCKISFDASSGSFGSRVDTLVSSDSLGKSVSFPRISPDGRYLVFTLSDYGNFSIWHREADLYQLNLSTGDIKPIDVLNSNETESYHSWSSDSRWMVFSSRRTDGLYTRPFIAYTDENGTFRKPFMLPQEDPEYYEQSLQSFNIPEFVTGKVKTNGMSMLKTIDSPAKNVTFGFKD